MGLVDTAIVFVKVVGGVWLAVVVLWFAKDLVWMIGRVLARALLPVERRILQWLQDRASARALGVDIEVLRVRRKSQFPRH